MLAAWPAPAEDAPADASEPVALEKLFQLPPSVDAAAPRYGGATRSEWESRFQQERARRDAAQAALEKAQRELSEMAADTSDWQMNAPGLGGVKAASGDKGPLSYRLHQEIRRQRDEISRSERRLQELRVEANLAGVPHEWIEPAPEAVGATGTSETQPAAPISADPRE